MERPSSVTVVLILLGTLLYIGTVRNQFVFDDEAAIRDNPIVHRFDPVEIFTSDYWYGYHGDRAGLYRPLTVLTFALNHAVGGRHPSTYHLVNALLHGLVVLLVCRLIDRVSGERMLALMSALIFAVHPALTETVAGLVGRADLLATLFALLSIELHFRCHPRFSWGAVISFLAALMCKENAIVVPTLILLFNYQQYRAFFHRSHLTICLRYGLFALVYLAWRWHVLGALMVPEISELDNPLVSLESELRVLNAAIVLGHYLRLLVIPVVLSADYSYAALKLATSLISLSGLFVIIVTVALVWLAILSWRKSPWIFLGGAWVVIALLPTSNLVVPIGTIMGERFLYLPAVGFALVVAAAFRSAATRLPRPVILTTALCYLFSFSALTLSRAEDWKSNFNLFSAAAERYPNSARIWRALGAAKLARQDHQGALEAWRQAIEIYPQYHEVFNDLGGYYINTGEYSQARKALQACLRIAPGYPLGWYNMALVEYNQSEHEAALSLLRTAVQLSPDYAAAHYNMGVILLETGNFREARRSFERTLEADPSFVSAHQNLRALERAH